MLNDIFAAFPNLLTMGNDMAYNFFEYENKKEYITCGFMRKLGSKSSQYNFSIPFYSCFILLSGKGKYIDTNENSYLITPGSLVQRLPNEIHSTEVDSKEEWLEFFINIGTKSYDYLNNLIPIKKHPYVSHCVITPKIMFELLTLFNNLKNAKRHELPEIFLDAQRMILLLHKSSIIVSESSTEKQLIEKACSLLESDLSLDIRMEDIADKLNIGYESFRKLFKQSIGISPMQYRTKQKIYKSQLSLLNGISIKETATLVGYGDCYSFSKQFAKTTGASPSAYRKQVLGGNA